MGVWTPTTLSAHVEIFGGSFVSFEDKATAVGPLRNEDGFQRDANNRVVAVAAASATPPLTNQSGFQRDASGALVVEAAPETAQSGFSRTASGAIAVQ